MHKLEHDALEDPFLAEAMEGYEKIPNQENNLPELKTKLQNRVSKKEYYLIPLNFKEWSIAASIILVIAFAGIYLNRSKENNPEGKSILTKKEMITSSPLSKDPLNKPDKLAEIYTDGQAIANITEAEQKIAPSTIVYDDITLEPAPEAISDSLITSSYARNRLSASLIQKNSFSETNDLPPIALMAKSPGNTVYYVEDETTKILNGFVTNKENGEALPGVNVFDEVTGNKTQTDINGEFKLLVKKQLSLEINYIGFEKKSIRSIAADSLIIEMEPSNVALSEVVVVDKSSKKPSLAEAVNSVAVNAKAGPTTSWKAFKDYLYTNAKTNYKIKGNVRLSFIINKDGSLTNFKILKSFNKAADEKAVSLIKNYASWQGSPDGIPQKVQINILFNR